MLLAKKLGPAGYVPAVGLDIAIIAAWAGLAMWTRRAAIPAFWIAVVSFAIDGLILLVLGQMLSLAFHAYALFNLWLGLQGAQRMRALGVPAPR